MESVEKARKALLDLYKKWAKEFEKIEDGKFLSKEYSNPYYISIPDDWFDRDKRIMIVGEEGYGEWGAGKQYGWKEGEPSWKFNDFNNIMDYNRIKTLIQVGAKLNPDEERLCNNTKNKFWIRFKQIYRLGLPCVWNNLDKIHLLGNKNCALSKEDRKKLHSVENKILLKEIEILKPTIVLFCGWSERESAFENELSKDICDKFYNDYDNYKPTKYKIYSIKNDDVHYIFSYHPHYANRIEGYEETVIDLIKDKSNIKNYENRKN